MEVSPTLHDLTDELKRLVGWGAKPHRLALMPVLRELAKAEGARFAQQGYIVLDYLKASIGCVEAPVPLEDREVEPSIAKRCYRLLFAIDSSWLKADPRRGRVIQLLGVYYSIETWRRPTGPERDFLYPLAEIMVNRAS